MQSYAVAWRRLALVVLAVGPLSAGPGPVWAQDSSDPGTIVVHPARVPVPGSPQSDQRRTNLPPPPPGPIESRLLPIPDGVNLRRDADRAASIPAPSAAAPVWSSPQMAPMAGPAGPVPAPAGPVPAPAEDTIAVIGFVGQSPNLTDGTKAELDAVAKRIAEKRLRHLELRAFAMGSGLDSRKVALARALVVRAYLIDRGVKSRLEVGSFAGDGQHVEIIAR